MTTRYLFTRDQLREIFARLFTQELFDLEKGLSTDDTIDQAFVWIEENMQPAHQVDEQPEPLLQVPNERCFIVEPDEPNEWYTDPKSAMRTLRAMENDE